MHLVERPLGLLEDYWLLRTLPARLSAITVGSQGFYMLLGLCLVTGGQNVTVRAARGYCSLIGVPWGAQSVLNECTVSVHSVLS